MRLRELVRTVLTMLYESKALYSVVVAPTSNLCVCLTYRASVCIHYSINLDCFQLLLTSRAYGKSENDIQREPVLPHELLIDLLLNLLKEMKKKGFSYLGSVLKVKVVNTVSIV